MSIEKYRQNIDLIDDELAALYAKRMELVKKIGEEKAKSGSAVLVAGREKEILNRIAKNADPALRPYLKHLFCAVFNTSRTYQKELSLPPRALIDEIKKAQESSGVFPDYATVACQGIAGAYSSLAAEKLFDFSDITYFKSFEGVFGAVQSGLCSFGVLPIENSSAGSVAQVYDLMCKYKFYIARSLKLRVSHNLLAPPKTDIREIKEILTHEQAAAQCAAYIKSLGGDIKITYCENTATAAEIVGCSGRRGIAAIASAECAGLYGLEALQSAVQDNDNNYTRFICISKDLKVYKNANKISVASRLPHEAGSLSRVLTQLEIMGINLTKIESRPIPGTDFEFLFYFDFEADITCPEVQKLLSCSLGAVTLLGSYSES